MTGAGRALFALAPADSADLARLHATGFQPGWPAKDFRCWLSAPDIAFGVGARDADGVLLGFGLCLNAGEAVDLATIATLPAARGCGVGKAVLAGLIAGAAQRGYSRMILEVAIDNPPALSIYTGAGFTPVGVRRGYYARTDGPAVDARIMTLDLPRLRL